MIIGGFVVVCMIIGKHQKNAKLFDRWRMREFHKQKIDEATVKKNVQIPSGTFWLLIFGRSSRCHSLPSPPRLHLGGGTGFEMHCGFVSNSHYFLQKCLIHITPLNTCPRQPKILRQGSQDRCSSESKTGNWQVPPSVTVVPLTFTFTLLCQCKCCCQCCLRALPRSRSTSAGHQHASRGYSRHFQSKFEVLFTERQSQSCIQNQLNMMRNGLDWNLMEIPFHSDSDWRES